MDQVVRTIHIRGWGKVHMDMYTTMDGEIKGENVKVDGCSLPNLSIPHGGRLEIGLFDHDYAKHIQD